jgi:aminodeoxyfutalosine synthase
VDGTIGKELVMHAAGAASPVGMARDRLERLIRDAGFIPAERDALHNIVRPDPDLAAV